MPALNAAAKEFDHLRQTLERLALAVLDQLRALEIAAKARDAEALHAIVARDREIDTLELTIDRLGRSFVELRAPLGPDFRYVMSTLDIARNLERIGDCAEYAARHVAASLAMAETFKPAWGVILGMIEKSREILEAACTSWQKADARLAYRIPDQDDEVDALQRQAYALVIRDVRGGLVDVELGMQTVLIANKLESLADIAAHIAESVVFMLQARQIRHQK